MGRGLDRKINIIYENLLRRLRLAFIDKELKHKKINKLYLDENKYEIHACEYIVRFLAKEEKEQKKNNHENEEEYIDKLDKLSKKLVYARKQLFG